MNRPLARHEANRHFEQARRRARLDHLTARLSGRDEHLLPFETVRAQLKQRNPLYRGLQQVPLAKIAGSVGRYREFTRQFLPLSDSFRDRWITIESLALSAQGWPPLELYQIGDVYFVKDGNHRVAVARQMEVELVEAYVWAFPSDVQLGPEDRLDDLLIRFGEEKFLAETGLDRLAPEHQIQFTTPGRYTELLAQIAEMQEKLSIIDERAVPYAEAVLAWYELVYLPAVQLIHDTGLLDEFPGRTESDLFVWLSLMRTQLSHVYGGEGLEEVMKRLATEYAEGRLGRLTRQVRRMLGQAAPAPLDDSLPSS